MADEIKTGDGAEQGGGDPEGKAGGDGQGKTYTQEQFQKALAKSTSDLKAKLEKSYEREKSRLAESLKGDISAQQRDEFETQLAQLHEDYGKKHEAAETEFQRKERKWKTDNEAAEKRATEAEAKFKNSTILRGLKDAAVGPAVNAATADLIVMALQATATLNDKDEVVVRRTVTENGEKFEKELTPAEAVKAMEENVAEFGTLFKSGIKGGLGANAGQGKITDLEKVPMSQYAELRKTPEGRRRLGLDE